MDGLARMCRFLLLNFVILFCHAANVHTSFEQQSNLKHDYTKPEPLFKMRKMNLLWEKAQRRLSETDLANLYAEIVIQDELELELKSLKADGSDQDGEQEALVRRKFLDIINKFDLRNPEERSANRVDENETIDKDSQDHKRMDKRLMHIWKKAEQAGFSAEELDELQQEFLHHQQSIDEFNQLKNEVDTFEDNSLDALKTGISVEEMRDKKTDLKKKWRALKEGYSNLERLGTAQNVTTEFEEPKVLSLWKVAKTANFTEIELESFKEELKHFEHKIKKHQYLRKEVHMSSQNLNPDGSATTDNIGEEKLMKMERKVADYTNKIKKTHTELKERLSKAMKHTEL